ncbi:hypothetical protein FRC04_004616 [Tulasnella sp. 424]|nr:hypothetical protein FRC04_004616 [Tulasnella sp. 424]KAG8972765.1 hypothetical protein FRC05_009595 [Tulasnella sp. 425]
MDPDDSETPFALPQDVPPLLQDAKESLYHVIGNASGVRINMQKILHLIARCITIIEDLKCSISQPASTFEEMMANIKSVRKLEILLVKFDGAVTTEISLPASLNHGMMETWEKGVEQVSKLDDYLWVSLIAQDMKGKGIDGAQKAEIIAASLLEGDQDPSNLNRDIETVMSDWKMGSGGDNSPTGSAAGSFISAKGENADPGSPFGDAMDIDSVLVEEPAALTTSALPPASKTMMQSPFAKPTTQFNNTWIGPKPSNAPSPLLSPTRGKSPDPADKDWMVYLTVDRSYRGKVKKPQGQAFSCGGFSDVHKCEVQFATPKDTNPKMAAVKVLRPVGLSNYDESEVLKKLIIRTSLEADAWSAIFHPNVVPLLGVTFTPVLSLISPWYEKGNLRNYLISNPNLDRLKLLLDVAKGLAHLHSQNPSVVHGDIKPENVLINDTGDALIIDFGLAMVMEENPLYSSSYRQGGSVMTGETPHSTLQDAKINFAICDPTSPKEPFDNWERYPQLPETIKKTIMMCWSRRPEKRPSMDRIEEGLQRLWEESVQNRT